MRPLLIPPKRCSKCGEIKHHTEFHKHSGRLCSWCRKCRSESRCTPEERAANNDRKLRLKSNRPKHYVARQMVIGARKRAKTKNIPFDITTEYVTSILPDYCPIFDTPLDYNSCKTNPQSPTLDRFYPKMGYVVGNVFVISHKANTIKNNSTVDELRAVLHWMEIIHLSARSEAHGATSGVRRNSRAEAKPK